MTQVYQINDCVFHVSDSFGDYQHFIAQAILIYSALEIVYQRRYFVIKDGIIKIVYKERYAAQKFIEILPEKPYVVYLVSMQIHEIFQ